MVSFLESEVLDLNRGFRFHLFGEVCSLPWKEKERKKERNKERKRKGNKRKKEKKKLEEIKVSK